MDNKPILDWDEVFNSQWVFPSDYKECIELAKQRHYRYLAFNGIVYNVNDTEMKNEICKETDLIKSY